MAILISLIFGSSAFILYCCCACKTPYDRLADDRMQEEALTKWRKRNP